TSRDALEVEDRDQHLEALRSARIGRQDGRGEPDALAVTWAGLAIAHTRLAHRNRTDASHNLALGQMPVANQPLAAIIGLETGVLGEKFRNLGLDRPRQQRTRAAAQNFGERIGESPWLGELENVSLGHGVSLLRWRSGGSNTPTIRRLTPSCRHQLSPIAPPSFQRTSEARLPSPAVFLSFRNPLRNAVHAEPPRRTIAVFSASCRSIRVARIASTLNFRIACSERWY